VTPLARHLAAAIARDGPLPLDRFIAACLTDPLHGYYRTRAAIGRTGDFVTAPEVSQVFGELIGLWLAAAWDGLGRPHRVTLVELGPGRGTLLADALRAIGQAMPAMTEALAVVLVETSPVLQAEQAAVLATGRLVRPPVWLADFAQVPAGEPLLLVANEFFDALPIRQFVFADGAWRERRVALAACGTALMLVLGDDDAGAAVPARLRTALGDPVEGDVVEVSAAGTALAAAIGSRIAADGGQALIVDYGPARPATGETLQAVAGHRFADPLARPGEADLSHHVDFAALVDAVEGAGAAAWGPIPQGLFLSRLGIAERAGRLAAQSPAEAAAIEGAVRRLVHPGRMGVLFKALAITPPATAAPPGFGRP
jgi:NADH dehydrogenase [ubiquinone] 1 alpha subcomplex assembly factor 7